MRYGVGINNKPSIKGMDMSEEKMCYVAVNPNAMDIAYAATAIMTGSKELVNDTADTVAAWIKAGAIVLYVDVKTAREMLGRYLS